MLKPVFLLEYYFCRISSPIYFDPRGRGPENGKTNRPMARQDFKQTRGASARSSVDTQHKGVLKNRVRLLCLEDHFMAAYILQKRSLAPRTLLPI